MTWLRYSDDHRRDPVWDGMPYDARWHYDCLVEACAQRHDGRIPMRTALRCSDVDDPDQCVKDLVAAGLLAVDGDVVVVLRADFHVPSPGVLETAAQAKLRQRRRRAHARGDHSQCRPEFCPESRDVTRDVGTGRDGTGLELLNEEQNCSEHDWPVTPAVPGAP